jgi:hypothetical protein
MVLQDHFRPPLGSRRHWHAFHNAWATYIASDLNRRLPEVYFAEPNVQFGIEIDVAAFEESPATPRGGGAPAAVWPAPAPGRTVPLPLVEETSEVLVFNSEGGPTLVGAIELVSPANKDRPAHRDAFVSKCAAYLQQGLGLVIVDAVTDRRADLHAELLTRLGSPVEGMGSELYAAAYRPVIRDSQPKLDVWEEALAVGGGLPTMPLWLPGEICVPVDLDSSYERTCLEQRISSG